MLAFKKQAVLCNCSYMHLPFSSWSSMASHFSVSGGFVTFCVFPFSCPPSSRRNPAVVLLITSWPPQWCCGCRLIKLVLVPWTLAGALPDRYVCILYQCTLQTCTPLLIYLPSSLSQEQKVHFVRCWISAVLMLHVHSSEEVKAQVCGYQEAPWIWVDGSMAFN